MGWCIYVYIYIIIYIIYIYDFMLAYKYKYIYIYTFFLKDYPHFSIGSGCFAGTSLCKTNITENQWLEDDVFFWYHLGRLFS